MDEKLMPKQKDGKTFIAGIKVGRKELPAIREKFRCWRMSKLRRLVRLGWEDFSAVKEQIRSLSFGFFEVTKDRFTGYYIVGRPATSEEIEELYPDLEDRYHVIKIAAV